MAHWLMKTEPRTWSWDDQVKGGIEAWDGVRNFQASANMKAMKRGDRCFFYHSGATKEIVGIVEVAKEYYPDPSDASGRFGMVDVKTMAPLRTAVSLAAIKAEPRFAELALVRHSRLSVMPIDDASWKLICEMGKTKP
jgi:predicted RNA-binding protein with PUA-like domain